ncbi:MAG: ABC transporter ATP-binding protein [Elusimicrobia bacterium]|nr:ABC transporter ATP-binding protein [Candidatus Liberimonas magnetica]
MTIYIRNLIKTYYLKNECKNVLTGVNLEIRAGQIFGLMGQNGSGKTTLLKILSTLILPTNGNVEICGFNIEDHPAKTRQSIGLSADPDTSFYQILSLRENIKFYGRLLDVEKDILDKRIDEFCEIFGLKEFFDVKLSQCPSGIKQKLAVIRAFLHEPEVLLIDEPARSLDEGSKLKILEFIRSVVKEKNKTCIMVTHALDEAKRFADRIGYLENGKITE